MSATDSLRPSESRSARFEIPHFPQSPDHQRELSSCDDHHEQGRSQIQSQTRSECRALADEIAQSIGVPYVLPQLGITLGERGYSDPAVSKKDGDVKVAIHGSPGLHALSIVHTQRDEMRSTTKASATLSSMNGDSLTRFSVGLATDRDNTYSLSQTSLGDHGKIDARLDRSSSGEMTNSIDLTSKGLPRADGVITASAGMTRTPQGEMLKRGALSYEGSSGVSANIIASDVSPTSHTESANIGYKEKNVSITLSQIRESSANNETVQTQLTGQFKGADIEIKRRDQTTDGISQSPINSYKIRYSHQGDTIAATANASLKQEGSASESSFGASITHASGEKWSTNLSGEIIRARDLDGKSSQLSASGSIKYTPTEKLSVAVSGEVTNTQDQGVSGSDYSVGLKITKTF